MTKTDERKRIAEAVKAPNFEKACEEQGFTVCYSAEEAKTKKKANI